VAIQCHGNLFFQRRRITPNKTITLLVSIFRPSNRCTTAKSNPKKSFRTINFWGALISATFSSTLSHAVFEAKVSEFVKAQLVALHYKSKVNHYLTLCHVRAKRAW